MRLARAPVIPMKVEADIAKSVYKCADKGFGVSRLQLMAKTGEAKTQLMFSFFLAESKTTLLFY